MIADINVRLSLSEVFAAMQLITNKGENAKNPGPQPQEPAANPAEFIAHKKRKYDSRKKQNHEYGKNEKHPEGVELKQDPIYELQDYRKFAESSESLLNIQEKKRP